MSYSSVEICAGGGGQALGLEMAGFHHQALVEYEPQFCVTLRKNRPQWNTRQEDIRNFPAENFSGVDLLAGGVPCPPFSIAGKQLGADDSRDMFPTAVSIVKKMKPRAVLFENVSGFASARFEQYRNKLMAGLAKLGYEPEWKLLQAANYGVPQLRPRFILVALRPGDAKYFEWPPEAAPNCGVGGTLLDLMGEKGWIGAEAWARHAAGIAPTIVGGSKLHGGPDLGPTRAKEQWRKMGVDGMGIADSAPDENFPEDASPKLTVKMVALLQSFPPEWEFCGKKTVAYRQVGNAFPPLVAQAVGSAIRRAFDGPRRTKARNKSANGSMRLLESAPKKKARLKGRK